MTRESWVKYADFGQKFTKSFHSGVICPQNQTQNLEGVKQAPHSEQATGQGMHCREILFTPHCSPRAREFPRSRQLFCITFGCGAMGRQSCPIVGFWPIFSVKTPKKYLPVTSLQHRGYIAKWLRSFHVIVEGPKGCFPAAEFFCDFW